MLLHLRTLLTWVYSIAADYPLNQAGRLLRNPENTQKSSAGLLSEQASRLITDLLLLLHTETGNQGTRKPGSSHKIRRFQEEFLRIGGRLLQIERVKNCKIWQVLVEIALWEKLGRWIEMPDREQERCFLYPGQETLFYFGHWLPVPGAPASGPEYGTVQ